GCTTRPGPGSGPLAAEGCDLVAEQGRHGQLQRDPVLARAMGEAGLRRAYRHYTWRTVAQQVAAIYAAVLAEARAPIAVTQPQE
ncbi:glycosyltransferase, partial [Massilia sp. CT11-108]|uniref:glycosyltransferase n=1 Tax=Massilia sp. CT11-108 TaxID=3393900 RepID=UPI0039A4FB86